MSVLAIIPARGGSKSIPMKNLAMVAGKPLLGWAIEAARAAETIDEVAVSSDNARILEAAVKWGARPVRRPAEISGDKASSESALVHVLSQMDQQPDITVMLACTSPLTSPEDIDGAVRAFIDQGVDSLFTVSLFHGFLWEWDSQGGIVATNHDPTRQRVMRQDNAGEYIESGNVYVFRTDRFQGQRFFGRMGMYEMPSIRCFDINEPPDLPAAEALLRYEEHRRGEMFALADASLLAEAIV